MKVDIETVGAALQELGIEKPVAKDVIKYLERAVQEEKDMKEKATPLKFVPLLLSLPHPDVPVEETPTFLIEHIDTIDHDEAIRKLIETVRTYNLSCKKKKQVFLKLGDIIEHFPRKLLKEVGIRIKNKEPLLIKALQNDVPELAQTESERED